MGDFNNDQNRKTEQPKDSGQIANYKHNAK
jgi:hypothetical protein